MSGERRDVSQRSSAKLAGLVLAVGASLASYAPNVASHHSFVAVFDRNQPIELIGTVSNVEWTNPHVWLYIDVAQGEAEREQWAFELGSPNALSRRGWAHDSLRVGDEVTVRGARARDGSFRSAALSVTLPTGENLFGAQNPSR
jgi:hypothetical protein